MPTAGAIRHLHPERRAMRSFFEGWYFKQQVGQHSIAFIPTRYTEEGGRRCALLQIITEWDSYVVPYPPG